MMTKIVFAGVGLLMITSPLVASAQTATVPSNASLIAVLTQLVQVLELEIQQLLKAQGGSTTPTGPSNPTIPTIRNDSANFTATPTSGTAPLAVTFNDPSFPIPFNLDFGDGTQITQGTYSSLSCSVSTGGSTNSGTCNLQHTYSAAGTYTAMLENSLGTATGTATITVNYSQVAAPTITITPGPQLPNSIAPQGVLNLPFTNITFTNTGSVPATVNSITVQNANMAPSSDAIFASVALLDASNNQVGSPQTLNSLHQATIGSPFTIAPGESEMFTVAGNIAPVLQYQGQTASLSIIAVNTSATVNGSLPITGAMDQTNNTMVCQPNYGYQCGP